MIGKQVQGTSFRGVLRYLHEKEGAERLGGNMVGENPRTLASEFRKSRQKNRRLQKVVYHASLSLPKTESLDNSIWLQIAQDYLNGMGFQGCQYVVYRHTDQDHDHIHVVASRIHMETGKTVSDSWNYSRSEKVIRQLEQAYQLETVVPSWEQEQRASTTGECRLMERTGKINVRKCLHTLLDELAVPQPQMPQVIEQLQQRGVSVKVWFTSTDQARGISYGMNGVAFSGSKLGKAYTFPGLQKYRGVEYKPERDNPLIQELMERDVSELQLDEVMPIEKEMAIRALHRESNAATKTISEPETHEDKQPEVIPHLDHECLAEEPEREKKRQKGVQIFAMGDLVQMYGTSLDEGDRPTSFSTSTPSTMSDRPTPSNQQQPLPTPLDAPQDCIELPPSNSEPIGEQTPVPSQVRSAPLSKKQRYQQLWERYSQTVQVSNLVKKDGIVARQAFQDGVNRKDISLMLVAGSSYVKELDERRGRAISNNYVNRIAENITGQSQRQLVQKRRVRELER